MINKQLFAVAEYATNNYLNWGKFFIESLLNEAGKLSKQRQPVQFYCQLEVIRALTGKIKSPRIEDKWNEIFTEANLSPEEKNAQEIRILKLKHKNSWTFKALFAY